MIGLPEDQLCTHVRSGLLAQFFDVIERAAAINLRLPFPKKVEVRPVEAVDDQLHRRFLPEKVSQRLPKKRGMVGKE
jgi:hypothetical protein